MSIIKTIYNLPIDYFTSDEKYGDSVVQVTYNGKKYQGHAQLHVSDAKFYSPRVGKTIALSKARINILKYEAKQAELTYKYKNQYYNEILVQGRKNIGEVDPTGSFSRNLNRSKNRMIKLQKALKQEQDNLKDYLKGYEKAIFSIEKKRKNKKKEFDKLNNLHKKENK